MAADPKAKRATYADLESVPAHMVAEILDGVLYTFPRPAVRHAAAASALGEELGPPFKRGRGGPGGWMILDEPPLHLGLGPDVVVPDLAGWRRERMPEWPNEAHIRLSPDWVCEVISPSTAAIDRSQKLPIYARDRVCHAWLVDPILQTLEVLRLDGDAWQIVGTWQRAAKVRAEPFDAIELDLAILWAR